MMDGSICRMLELVKICNYTLQENSFYMWENFQRYITYIYFLKNLKKIICRCKIHIASTNEFYKMKLMISNIINK